MSVEPPRLSAPDPAATIALLLENVSSLGSIEVGASVSMLFLGVAILQTWNYYRDFPKDPASLKILVAVLITLEIVHSILFVHATYHYTIAGLVDALRTGDPTFLVTTPWSLQTMVAVEAVTVILVQAYYYHRILLITSSRIIALSCLLLALTRFGLSIALLVTDIVNPTIAVVHSPTFAWEAITAISIGAFSDLFIAACMCGGLLRRRTGFVGSNRLVDRLVGYILASGVATSIASLAQLIVYFAMPTTYTWVAVFGVVSKLFSNSLLASLNQRRPKRIASRSSQSSNCGAARFTVRGRSFSASALEMASLHETQTDTKHVTQNDVAATLN